MLSGQLWAPPASCRGHPAPPRSPWLYSDSRLSLLRFLQALPQTQLFWASGELVSERRVWNPKQRQLISILPHGMGQR